MHVQRISGGRVKGNKPGTAGVGRTSCFRDRFSHSFVSLLRNVISRMHAHTHPYTVTSMHEGPEGIQTNKNIGGEIMTSKLAHTFLLEKPPHFS